MNNLTKRIQETALVITPSVKMCIARAKKKKLVVHFSFFFFLAKARERICSPPPPPKKKYKCFPQIYF